MRAIGSLSGSSSLRLGLLFAFLMILAACFVGYSLLAEGSETSTDHGWSQSLLQSIAGWALIVFLLLSAIASLGIGFFVFNRINRIADTAGNIMTSGKLSARLPIDSSWDDLSKLSLVLNRMLGEIEGLMGSVQAVSDNIAHDLRSPLTRLKAQIDRVDDASLRASLREDVDSILSMFNALLRIAEIEAEKQKQTFAEIRLDKVLLDAIDLYQPLADAKDIAINTSLTDCSVIGDRDLLFQAMSNLLDNAIKFSPEKSDIDISVSIKGDVAVVEIADYGSGIPDPLKQEATKRFFRIDESRSAPGHGLGLAMVAAIVKRHEGSLSLHDTRDHAVFPGLCCRLRLEASAHNRADAPPHETL